VNTGLAIDLMRGAMQVALLVAAPLLLAALAVGLVVGLLQAVTQVQEQTLTFIPKLLVISLVLVIAMPWLLSSLVRYLAGILQSLPILAT
jgi:flagellar biosynthetic protein FliQ